MNIQYKKIESPDKDPDTKYRNSVYNYKSPPCMTANSGLRYRLTFTLNRIKHTI